MKRNDSRMSQLRKRFRSSDCADAAALAAFVDRNLPEADHEAVRMHVQRCDACFDAVTQLLGLKGQSLPELPGYLSRHAIRVGTREPGRAGFRAWKWAGATAALAASLLIGAGLWVNRGAVVELPGEDPQTTTLRGGTEPGENLVLVFPSEGARLVPGRVRFAWEALPGAVAYSVRLVDESGTLVWNTRVTAETAAHPEPELPAGDYFVSIQALLADGRSVTGDFVRFSVTR